MCPTWRGCSPLMTADPAGHARTGPGPLYLQIADQGSLRPFGEEIEAGNPSDWPGYPAQLRRARALHRRPARRDHRPGHGRRRAVRPGRLRVPFLGGSMGVAEGARIAPAFAVATAERLPVVSVAASGGSRMQEGTSALMQMQAVAAAVAAPGSAGIPHIAVAGDPTTGGVWASLVAGADVLIGVPGARVSFSGSPHPPRGRRPGRGGVPRGRPNGPAASSTCCVPWLGCAARSPAALRLLSPRSRGGIAGSRPGCPPGRPGRRRQRWPRLPAWAQRARARAARAGPARTAGWPATSQRTFEIRGDRCGGVDDGLRCGFGSHDGVTHRVYRADRPADHGRGLPDREPAAHAGGTAPAAGADPDRHAGRRLRPGRRGGGRRSGHRRAVRRGRVQPGPDHLRRHRRGRLRRRACACVAEPTCGSRATATWR